MPVFTGKTALAPLDFRGLGGGKPRCLRDSRSALSSLVPCAISSLFGTPPPHRLQYGAPGTDLGPC